MIITRHNMSVVTIIIGRHRAKKVLQDLFADGIHSALLTSARGTLMQDKWYQSILSMIRPELAVIQMIVPDPFVDRIMERAARLAQLHRSGAGSIFSKPCVDLHVKGTFPLWPIDQEELPEDDASNYLCENLTAIYLISQGERTEAVCRAAMNAGSHGPIILFSEGHGLRDRLGWLRITNKPTKEIVSVLVENVDADLVFAAMAEVGQVEHVGRGLIYRMSVQKGLINIDSVYSKTRHAASIQQIIHAIDDIKGNKDWRDQDSIAMHGGATAGLGFMSKLSSESVCKPRTLISILVYRDNSHEISRQIINMGAPGANINYFQFYTQADSTQHQEFAQISIIVDEPSAIELEKRILNEVEQDLMIFTQPVTHSISYELPMQDSTTRMYRGVPIS